jgi:hypothetical protein
MVAGGGAASEHRAAMSTVAALPLEPPAAPARASRRSSLLLFAAKLALSGGILAYLFARGKISTGDLRKGLDAPCALALAGLIVGAHFAAGAARWWLLVRSQDIEASYGAALRFNFIGMFFNTFMPGAVGGDAVKCWYIARGAPAGKRLEAAASVLLDRAVGLVSLVLLALAAVAVDAALGAADAFSAEIARIVRAHLGPLARAGAVAGGIALALFTIALLVRPGAGGAGALARLPGAEIGRRVAFVFGRAALRPRLVLAAFLVSWAAHALTIASLVVIGRAIGDDLAAARYFILVPIGLMIQAVPGPPGGLGVGELAFYKLFEIAGRASLGATICAIWHALVIAWNLVGGIVYIAHVAHARPGGEASPLLQSTHAAPP